MGVFSLTLWDTLGLSLSPASDFGEGVAPRHVTKPCKRFFGTNDALDLAPHIVTGQVLSVSYSCFIYEFLRVLGLEYLHSSFIQEILTVGQTEKREVFDFCTTATFMKQYSNTNPGLSKHYPNINT